MENSTVNRSQGANSGSTVSIEPSWAYVGVGIYSVIAFLILTGNLLVVIAFLTTPKLKTKTNYFIFSLAVADILVGLFSVPLWIYFVLIVDFTSLLYQYYQLGDILSGVSSILHLTCVSVERCYAILAPLKHREIRKVTIYGGIVLSWLLAILSASLLKILRSRWKDVPVFITFAFFFVPLMVIFAAYIAIFITAKKSLKEHRKRSLKKDLHIAYTIALIIGVFVICWLPFFLTILLYKWCDTCIAFVYDMRVLMIVKMLHYGNSALNPIIYSVRNRSFSHAFKRILKRPFSRNPDSEYHGMDRAASYRKTTQIRLTSKAKTFVERSPHNSETPDEDCQTVLV